jgi:hypothetical protein
MASCPLWFSWLVNAVPVAGSIARFASCAP